MDSCGWGWYNMARISGPGDLDTVEPYAIQNQAGLGHHSDPWEDMSRVTGSSPSHVTGGDRSLPTDAENDHGSKNIFSNINMNHENIGISHIDHHFSFFQQDVHVEHNEALDACEISRLQSLYCLRLLAGDSHSQVKILVSFLTRTRERGGPEEELSSSDSELDNDDISLWKVTDYDDDGLPGGGQDRDWIPDGRDEDEDLNSEVSDGDGHDELEALSNFNEGTNNFGDFNNGMESDDDGIDAMLEVDSESESDGNDGIEASDLDEGDRNGSG
ncbi:hypothetical protein MKZ38_000583 [Zalerion maritima]|uniref:Uncharacterized protein n=1 Tax=Zalerion maritima TaxID=339359 RepID=A0AAD5RRE4_9PEZI|nr:hypothetical protein MKZ38_000583 [Zalerion maritima]